MFFLMLSPHISVHYLAYLSSLCWKKQCLSQAVIHQILTAGIGVSSRANQVLLVADKMAEKGSSPSASFPIVNYHTADVPHSSVILRNDTGFLSGRLSITSLYDNTGEEAGQPGSCPGAKQ